MRIPQATSNFLAGNASFSSSDGSLLIDGGPAQGQIDFRATGSFGQGDNPGSFPGGFYVKHFLSDILDASIAGNAVPLIPPMPGFLASHVRMVPIYATGATGTINAAPGPTWKAGNNAARDNWVNPIVGPATSATVPQPGRICTSVIAGLAPGKDLIDLGNLVWGEIVTPAEGAVGFRPLVRISTVLGYFRAGDL